MANPTKMLLTEEEVIDISRALMAAKEHPFNRGCKAADLVEGMDEVRAAECSVITGYMPDGPGWTGDIYTLIWGECCYYSLVGIGSGECKSWVNAHDAYRCWLAGDSL